MMEFTKEWIEKCRQKIGFGWSSTGQSTISAIAKLALDEIERLQSEREQTCKWIKTRIGKQVGLHNHFYISCIKENRLCDDIEVTYCKYCGKKVEYVEES